MLSLAFNIIKIKDIFIQTLTESDVKHLMAVFKYLTVRMYCELPKRSFKSPRAGRKLVTVTLACREEGW